MQHPVHVSFPSLLYEQSYSLRLPDTLTLAMSTQYLIRQDQLNIFLFLFLSILVAPTISATILTTNATASNVISSFEDSIELGLRQIVLSAPAYTRSRLAIYNVAAIAPRPKFLSLSDPEITIARAIDPSADILYTARSLVNEPPDYTIFSRPWTAREPIWKAFVWPRDLQGYHYVNAMRAFSEFAEGMGQTGAKDLASCRVGIPPVDPFQPTETPRSVLWICHSPMEPSGRQWVLKCSNGLISKFSWSSMGLPSGGLLDEDVVKGNSSAVEGKRVTS